MIEKCAFLEAAKCRHKSQAAASCQECKKHPEQANHHPRTDLSWTNQGRQLFLFFANLSGGWGDNTKGEDIPDSKSSGGLSITTFRQVNRCADNFLRDTKSDTSAPEI